MMVAPSSWEVSTHVQIIIHLLVILGRPGPVCVRAKYLSRWGDLFQEVRSSGEVYTLAWSISLVLPNKSSSSIARDSEEEAARTVAREVGLLSRGVIGQLRGHFLLVHPYYYTFRHVRRRCRRGSRCTDEKELFRNVTTQVTSRLSCHPLVRAFQQEVFRKRVKREVLRFEDPLFHQQWHLVNRQNARMDLNVSGVWEQNVTGRGVTVCVVDDGLDWTHPDLEDNYSQEGSWDLNSDDPDPMPLDDGNDNQHGTRCAGEIAAVPNHFCGVGVAFQGRVSGIRVLDGKMTDSLEAMAFTKNQQVNDIYSCSWGPDDDGETIDGPHYLAQQALANGVTYGRNGYGTIYVVASGNGGMYGDNCNFDGYANSIYTVTIGAVDELGHMPYYAEECTCMLAVSYSSGESGLRGIVTTDWHGNNPKGCTLYHTGTSAAAPLAAGVIALMLQVQPCLTWRDVQYLIVLTSVKIDNGHAAWYTNAAGLHHSHQHGFGVLDAWRLVAATTSWESVPFLTSHNSPLVPVRKDVPPFHHGSLQVNMTVDERDLATSGLKLLEYVQVKVTVVHEKRGSLRVQLRCPSGSESVLGAPRPKDKSTEGLKGWIFTTVRCWGEEPQGTWTLIVADQDEGAERSRGMLISWQLILHGTPMTKEEFKRRQSVVEETCRSSHLRYNTTSRCHRPQPQLPPAAPVPEKWLKILTVTGLLLAALTFYQLVEDFCWNRDNKQENSYQHLGSTESRTVAEDEIGREEVAVANVQTEDEGRLSSDVEDGM